MLTGLLQSICRLMPKTLRTQEAMAEVEMSKLPSVISIKKICGVLRQVGCVLSHPPSLAHREEDR